MGHSPMRAVQTAIEVPHIRERERGRGSMASREIRLGKWLGGRNWKSIHGGAHPGESDFYDQG